MPLHPDDFDMFQRLTGQKTPSPEFEADADALRRTYARGGRTGPLGIENLGHLILLHNLCPPEDFQSEVVTDWREIERGTKIIFTRRDGAKFRGEFLKNNNHGQNEVILAGEQMVREVAPRYCTLDVRKPKPKKEAVAS